MTRQRWHNLYNEAIQAAEAGEYESAAAKFGASIEAGSPRWEAYYGRAWARLRSGDSDDDGAQHSAEADLRRALEIGGPFCADAAALLGTLLLTNRKYDEALYMLLHAFGRSSESESVESAIAECLTGILDEFETAPVSPSTLERLQSLESSIKASDLPPQLASGLIAEIVATNAFCLQKLDRGAEAEESLDRLSQLSSGHARLPIAVVAGKPTTKTSSGGRQEPTFDDVGGIDVAGTFQSKLRAIFDTYFSRSDIEATRKRIEEYGQRPTRSILLFGPSGCGKTFIIRAFSGEHRKRFGRELPIHRAKLDEMFDRYVGESEKNLTRLFDEAIATQPSILFFDEIDSIGGSRDKGQDWKSTQTSHLLQQFDRLQNDGAFVILFGCTNRIWSVELALLRRFDELFPVEMPDQKVRERIFEVLLSKLAPRLRPRDPAYVAFAKAAHGLTPGDIEKVVKKSVDTLLVESEIGEEARALENENVLTALRQFKNPHVRSWLRDSVEGLRAAGHAEMVADVERMYGGYVENLDLESDTSQWRFIPEEAFAESQEYDLRLMRTLRSRS